MNRKVLVSRGKVSVCHCRWRAGQGWGGGGSVGAAMGSKKGGWRGVFGKECVWEAPQRGEREGVQNCPQVIRSQQPQWKTKR